MLFHDTKTTTLPPWRPRAQNRVERLLPSHTHKKLRCKGECSWRPFFGSFWCFEMTSILWMVGLTNCKIFANPISKLRYLPKSRVRLKLRFRSRQVARRRGALALQWGKQPCQTLPWPQARLNSIFKGNSNGRISTQNQRKFSKVG